MQLGYAIQRKLAENHEFRELEEAKAVIKKLKKQAEEDKKVIAILRDATAFLPGEPEIKYGLLYPLKDEGHSLKKECELLKASASGFYDWLKNKTSKRT